MDSESLNDLILNDTWYLADITTPQSSQRLQVVYIGIIAVIVGLAIGGNIFVVWVVVAHERMRTAKNYFLVNVAVADVILVTFVPLFVSVGLIYDSWIFGRAYCKFLAFIGPCAVVAKAATLMAVAVERYLLTFRSDQRRMKASVVLVVVIVIWCLSALIALPDPLHIDTVSQTWSGGEEFCYLQIENAIARTAYLFYAFLVSFFIPVCTLFVVYTVIGIQLWSHLAIGNNQPEHIRVQRQIVRMMIVVSAIFVVCLLPEHLLNIIFLVYPDFYYPASVFWIFYGIRTASFACNPIIYCCMNAGFRNGFKYAFRWLPCVTWNPNDAISAECDEPPAAEVCAGELMPMSKDGNVDSEPPKYSDVTAGIKTQSAGV